MGLFFKWLETWFGMVRAVSAVLKPNFKRGFQVNGTDYTADALNTALAGTGAGVQTPITAFATGGQASATALTGSYCNVTTCATAGDSVQLPAAAAGVSVTVRNSGAATLAVWPNYTTFNDSINALAINLPVDIPPLSECRFESINGTVWYTSPTAVYLTAPTTQTGGVLLKAAASAANYITTIINASQAAARTYTIPDAGANASFVMTAGAQTISGIKTFGGTIVAASISNTDPASSVQATTIQAGSTGVAGILQVLPVTASKGKVSLSTSANTGNTETAIVVAAQAEARTYALPDWSTKASEDTECSLAGIKVVADTTNRPGALGCLLYATGNDKLYVCTTASATAATWTVVGTQS